VTIGYDQFLVSVTVSNTDTRIHKSEGYLEDIVHDHSTFFEEISLNARPYVIAVAVVTNTASNPSVMFS
jgi:hypothetical protein